MANHHGSLPPLTLVLGGARSGKSAYAESMLSNARERLYVATAQAQDGEMQDRIRQHQARRGAKWVTIEEPIDLVGALSTHCRPDRPAMVDCLTLWVTNLMLSQSMVDQEIERFLRSLPDFSGPVVFVASEVGLGIVPDNAMARLFRDHAGRLNQLLAAHCQRVVFVAAGLPLLLKDIR